MRFIILMVLFFSVSEIFASTSDTVNIYLSESSISYKKLKKIWFPQEGMLSYTVKTRQDEIATNDSSYYFKVYDRKRHLLLEGEKIEFGRMNGVIRFYYQNGITKRIEFYRTDTEFDKLNSNAMDSVVRGFDGTRPWGTWTYYNKSGQVTKTIVYSVEKSQDRNEICEIITTTTFGSNGKVKSNSSHKKECRENNGT